MAARYAASRPRLKYRFFVTTAVIMTLVIVAGFSMQLAMGRSTFRAPAMVHVHALLFFGWTVYYLLQNLLAGAGSITLHKLLGWFGTVWATLVVGIGIYTTVSMVRRGATPFFFQPAYFLFMNSLGVLCFGGLVAAAVVMRRQTLWHSRLMLCSMAMLTGPAVGRLLPMPLMIPWAAWGVFAAIILFPLAGMVVDLRSRKSIHPALWWGAGAMFFTQVAIGVVASSTIGNWLYQAIVAGTAGEGIPGLIFQRG
jgi:hypothetical protein